MTVGVQQDVRYWITDKGWAVVREIDNHHPNEDTDD